MGEKTLKRTSRGLTASVVEQLDRMLGDGRLVPGQRLVESDLAAELGVGTMSVREALRILAGDGIVELVPHKGASVRKFASDELIGLSKVMAGLLIVGIEALVESPNYSRHMQVLKQLHRQMRLQLGSGDTLGLLDSLNKYQNEIMEASGNECLILTNHRLHFRHYARHVSNTLVGYDLSEFSPFDGRLNKALADRDVELARRISRESLQKYVEVLQHSGGAAASPKKLQPSGGRTRARRTG